MRCESPEKKNICAVIVTYHPDASFSDHVKCIARQVGQVVVVDNHSDSDSVSMLQDSCKGLKVELILNDCNLGVAAALNQGVNLAHEMAFSWVLLFDQDTRPLDFMVHTLAAVYKGYPEKDRLALIGSNYYKGDSGRVSYESGSDASCLWMTQKAVITSGSLLRVSVFREIGPFRDELFIDHVDHEYCLRARGRGFDVVVTCSPVMMHSIGTVTWHNFLWRKAETSNHSALRRYYMARNDIVIAKEYMSTEPVWVLGKLYSRFTSIVLICFFEKHKLAKLKLSALGFLDGLTSNFNRKVDDSMCDD
jgi:rhamnosyltransferase